MCRGRGFFEEPPNVRPRGSAGSGGGAGGQLTNPDRAVRTVRSARAAIGRSSSSAGPSESTSDISQQDHAQVSDPIATLRRARARLKASDWEETMAGLDDVAAMAVTDPDIVDWDILGLAMTRLVDGFSAQKNRVVRCCCRVLRQLFRTKMGAGVHRPQFDDAVFELMKKTADTSRVVRAEADETLDVMASHVPVQYAIRAVLDRAPRHKNPVIRYTAMRLVECVVATLGVDTVVSHAALREARKQIVSSLCLLIDDQNQDVRWTVRRALMAFMRHPQFDDLLVADVDPGILKKADKSLTLLLYDNAVDQQQPLAASSETLPEDHQQFY